MLGRIGTEGPKRCEIWWLIQLGLLCGCGTDPWARSPDDSAHPDAISPDDGSGVLAPRAKGLWIWYFSRSGLTPQQVASMAQQIGIGYVLIKSGQDDSYWSTRYNAQVVNEFTSRGVQVFAWVYVTPSNVPASVTAAAQAASVPGTSGMI